MMELLNPTGLIDDILQQQFEPRRRMLRDIIVNVADTPIDSQTVVFCEISIMNQCRTFLTTSRRNLEFSLGQPLTPELITRLAEHISCFSIAGIQAVCERHSTE